MEVSAPRLDTSHPDRQLSCEEALDVPIRDLVDDAITKGWKAEEVYAAIESVVKAQRIAYGYDPDPADE